MRVARTCVREVVLGPGGRVLEGGPGVLRVTNILVAICSE